MPDSLIGCRLIRSRSILDIVTLLMLLYSTVSPVDQVHHTVIFIIPYVVTLLSAGLTNRWPLSFPMIPLLALQILRQSSTITNSSIWGTLSGAVTGISVLLIIGSAALCILFPAVHLPPMKGSYHVGVADFFLPVDMTRANRENDVPSHVSVRLLYPTLQKPGGGLPYLNHTLATEYCRQTMSFGAPALLKRFDWFLHYWRLIRVPVHKHAPLIPKPSRLPIVVYSHGLGGSSELYSYQTIALASRGNVVLSINHSDGSAPAVLLPNGKVRSYDHSVAQLWLAKDHNAYIRRRRSQADYRAREFLASVDALFQLNVRDNLDLLHAGICLRGRLDVSQCCFMGHSFGGATALVAASRRPELARQVVAHEPAVDWMTDDARRSLFAPHLIHGLSHSYSGGTGGYVSESSENNRKSIHDLDILVLYSRDWYGKNWGESHIIQEMHQKGRLGRKDGLSNFCVVPESHHMEFSDVPMLTPLWLARVAGQGGKRNPNDVAFEIEEVTHSWLNQTRHVETLRSQ